MSKRKTVGERTIDTWGRGYLLSYVIRDYLTEAIDRAIRRAQAKAYDEGYGRAQHDAEAGGWTTTNPYRGRPKL